MIDLGEVIEKDEWNKPMKYVTQVLFCYHRYQLQYQVEPVMNQTRNIKDMVSITKRTILQW